MKPRGAGFPPEPGVSIIVGMKFRARRLAAFLIVAAFIPVIATCAREPARRTTSGYAYGYPNPGYPQGYPPSGYQPGYAPPGYPPAYPPGGPGYQPQQAPPAHQPPAATPWWNLPGVILGQPWFPQGGAWSIPTTIPATIPTTFPWPWPWATPTGPANTTAPPTGTSPPPPPDDGWPGQWAVWEQEVLMLTNQRRSMGANCGGQVFGPAGTLMMHPLLRRAARGHSKDMGERNYFSHTSPDGRSPTDRARASGWSGGVGENIYGGATSPADAVEGWMNSPGHCRNIMDPGYKVIGIGYAQVQGSQFTRYWTQNFGL